VVSSTLPVESYTAEIAPIANYDAATAAAELEIMPQGDADMSWDVSIMKFSKNYDSVEAITDNESPLPLGSLADVHSAVSDIFLGTDWTDPVWGLFDSDFGSIEFNLGDDDPATSMMLHVRASNDIVHPIIELCRQQSWTAIDCSTGEFLEKDPTAGIEGWRAFRDKVIGQESGA
jgi:hypothetical protein